MVGGRAPSLRHVVRRAKFPVNLRWGKDKDKRGIYDEERRKQEQNKEGTTTEEVYIRDKEETYGPCTFRLSSRF